MLGIPGKLPSFVVIGVKRSFHVREENRDSCSPGKKTILFYPRDFSSVCPTEMAEFARLSNEFVDLAAGVPGGSTGNKLCKLAWRRAQGPKQSADLAVRRSQRRADRWAWPAFAR